MTMTRTLTVAASVGVYLLLAGCTRTSPVEHGAGESELTKVELALNWIPDSQHGGFYAAKVHGFFEEAGLDVTISPGGPNAPVIQKVAMNRAQFGVGNADQILMARQQEADVVAVFAGMQNSPRCIMVHADSPCRTLEELRDVTLAVGPGKAYVKFLQSKLSLVNVNMVPYTGSIVAFLNDKSFAQQAYVFSEPYVAQSRGATTRCMMVSDLGFNPYSSCLFVNGDLLKSDPELVRRMTMAVRRGWRTYLETPESANAEIRKANPEMDDASLRFGANSMKKLCAPTGELNAIGQMDGARWRVMAEQLVELGFLDSATGFDDAFTTRVWE